MDSGPAAIHDDRMSKIEVIRVALLAIVGAALLAFDLYFVYGMSFTNVFNVMALLHTELVLVTAGVVFWPAHRWLRFLWGGFVTTIVALVLIRLIDDSFMSTASFFTLCAVTLLMVASFCATCGIFFVFYRKIFGKRLSLFGRSRESNTGTQFGLQRLLIITACFAIVAFAARAVFPDQLEGQFSINRDMESYWIAASFSFFPALFAGPLTVAILRPASWWAILILPWYLFVYFCEMVAFSGFAIGPAVTPGVTEFMRAAISFDSGYFEIAAMILVAGLVARLGGLKLE